MQLPHPVAQPGTATPLGHTTSPRSNPVATMHISRSIGATILHGSLLRAIYKRKKRFLQPMEAPFPFQFPAQKLACRGARAYRANSVTSIFEVRTLERVRF